MTTHDRHNNIINLTSIQKMVYLTDMYSNIASYMYVLSLCIFHCPETITQVVDVLHPYSLVDASSVCV